MQTAASQNVLIFLFGLVDLIGVGGERRLEHKFFSAQGFTSTQVTWNDSVLGMCQSGIKKNCFQHILRVGSFFPPKGWVIG